MTFQEFIVAYQSDYGETISPAEAREMAACLLATFRLLATDPAPETDVKLRELGNHDIDLAAFGDGIDVCHAPLICTGEGSNFAYDCQQMGAIVQFAANGEGFRGLNIELFVLQD